MKRKIGKRVGKENDDDPRTCRRGTFSNVDEELIL